MPYCSLGVQAPEPFVNDVIPSLNPVHLPLRYSLMHTPEPFRSPHTEMNRLVLFVFNSSFPKTDGARGYLDSYFCVSFILFFSKPHRCIGVRSQEARQLSSSRFECFFGSDRVNGMNIDHGNQSSQRHRALKRSLLQASKP